MTTTFKPTNDGKSYISIKTKDLTLTLSILIADKRFKNIKRGETIIGKGEYDEIFIEMPEKAGVGMGFSLKELKEALGDDVIVDTFYLEMKDKNTYIKKWSNHFGADHEDETVIVNEKENKTMNTTTNKTTKNATTTAKIKNDIELKPTMPIKERKKFAASTVKNAVGIGTKRLAWVPVELLNIEGYQRNREEHLSKIAANWDDAKCNVLLVSYDENNGWFNVIDGQHRAIAAKMRGIDYLVCEIFDGLTTSSEAVKFVEENVNSKKLTPYDTYRANQFVAEEDDTELSKIDKRIATLCDKYNIAVEKNSACKTLKSVTQARKIMKQGGEDDLSFVFDVISDSHWDKHKNGYSYIVMESIHQIYTKNKNDKKALNDAKKLLSKTLMKTDPKKFDAYSNEKYKDLLRLSRWCEAMNSIVA